ncbi:MAG: aspartyl protease family protein [Limisphaerales bacterium]
MTLALASATLVSAELPSSQGSEFPFVFRDGLLWVQVKTAGSDKPMNFLLDSGAGASALDSQTARHLGIRLGEPVTVHGVHTQTVGHWSPRLTVSVGGVSLREEFLVVDLGELGRGCHCLVDGLLGVDFFRHRVVQIDFEAQRIRLLPPASPAAASDVQPLRNHRGALLVPLRVNDGELHWVRLDTGCASGLQWVVSGQRPVICAAQISIGLAKVPIPTTLTTVQLGDRRFERVSTGLHDQPIFPGESGLLGNGLLSRFTLTVDPVGGRLILDKRTDP